MKILRNGVIELNVRRQNIADRIMNHKTHLELNRGYLVDFWFDLFFVVPGGSDLGTGLDRSSWFKFSFCLRASEARCLVADRLPDAGTVIVPARAPAPTPAPTPAPAPACSWSSLLSECVESDMTGTQRGGGTFFWCIRRGDDGLLWLNSRPIRGGVAQPLGDSVRGDSEDGDPVFDPGGVNDWHKSSFCVTLCSLLMHLPICPGISMESVPVDLSWCSTVEVLVPISTFQSIEEAESCPARLNVLAPPESRPPPCNSLLAWTEEGQNCSVWRTETDLLASNHFGFAAMHGLMDFWRVMKLSSSEDDSLEPSQIASNFGPSGKFCSSFVCFVAGLQKTSTGSTISPLQADTALSMPGNRTGEEARSQTIERLGRLFQSSSRRLVVFVPRLQVTWCRLPSIMSR